MISLPAHTHGVLALGWATVELERAAVELSHLLVPGAAFLDAPPTVTLGARCRVGPSEKGEGLRIVLLEPETEGRLAARLARYGEGWSVSWEASATEPPDPSGRDPGRPRRAASAARSGPFGLERLALAPLGTAPLRLLIDVPSQP